MNKKFIGTLIIILSLLTFSCKQRDTNAATTTTEVVAKTDALASVTAVAQPDSLHRKLGARYKKRSCCVGAPSRFKTDFSSFAKKN